MGKLGLKHDAILAKVNPFEKNFALYLSWKMYIKRLHGPKVVKQIPSFRTLVCEGIPPRTISRHRSLVVKAPEKETFNNPTVKRPLYIVCMIPLVTATMWYTHIVQIWLMRQTQVSCREQCPSPDGMATNGYLRPLGGLVHATLSPDWQPTLNLESPSYPTS